jgi:hypothetical protein
MWSLFAIESSYCHLPGSKMPQAGLARNTVFTGAPTQVRRHKSFLACAAYVCESLLCMTSLVKDETVSVRIPASEKKVLMASARQMGVGHGTLAAADITEGNRRRRFPAIEFRDGCPGRVAYLVASRWPVWLIVELVEEFKGDIAAAAAHMRKPAALVNMVMDYAGAYPQEIEDCRMLANRRDFEAMRKIIPGLEQM